MDRFMQVGHSDQANDQSNWLVDRKEKQKMDAYEWRFVYLIETFRK